MDSTGHLYGPGGEVLPDRHELAPLALVAAGGAATRHNGLPGGSSHRPAQNLEQPRAINNGGD